LNSFGKEVIVLDANLTTPNVGLHLGAPIVPVNLNHVLSGKASINEAVYEHDSGTKIVPSSLSVRDLHTLDSSKLPDIGRKLKKMADFVLYDCAAGLGSEAMDAMEAADELINHHALNTIDNKSSLAGHHGDISQENLLFFNLFGLKIGKSCFDTKGGIISYAFFQAKFRSMFGCVNKVIGKF